MLLSVEKLTKYHNDTCIFKDISFSIEETDKIALLGVNGAGKTTLLNILAGKEHYDQGRIITKSGLTIAYLSQNPSLDDSLTIMEQVTKEAKQGKEAVEEFEIKSVLTKLGFQDFDINIAVLSGGQRKRVALGATLLHRCDLLILDEPTNHLDNDMVAWLEAYLMKYKGALLMVTHDRYFMDRITNTILEIDRCSIYRYHANYSKFLELKQQREEMDLSSERKRKSILKKELEWIRSGVQARGTKSKERIERFEKLSSIQKIKTVENVQLDTVSSRLGRKIIEIEDIAMGYGSRCLFHDVSYHVKRHDRIGILGPNGCGKTTLLHIIAKYKEPLQGSVVHGDTVRLGYYKQSDEDMNVSMRVIDYITETSNEIETQEGTCNASQMLERFLFDASLQYSTIGRLSGGERRRLYLLKVLMEAPNVLLLDEPTNDLDIQTLQILEDYLDCFDGVVITVSHDRYFLDRICDLLFVFQENGTIKQYIGGYSSYIAHANMYTEKKEEAAVKENRKQSTVIPRFTSEERRELETIDDALEQAQKLIDQIDSEMQQSLDDFEKVKKLSLKRETACVRLEETMERWMYLQEKKQQIENAKKR